MSLIPRWRKKPRPYEGTARITLESVHGVNGADGYWSCAETGQIYKLVPVPTMSLAELIATGSRPDASEGETKK